jgi:hypothetical protein
MIDGKDNANLPTRSNIMSKVDSVAKMSESEDTILFAFSGHGIEEENLGYLLPADARIGILAETAISIKWVKSKLQDSSAKAKVMILDSCHAGARMDKASIGPMTEKFAQEIFDVAEGFATLSSCKSNEVSHEWEDKQHGVFSYYLVEGLIGLADTNKDQRITIADASGYVTPKVKQWALINGYQQSPTLECRVSGDIVLVRVPRPSGEEVATAAIETPEGLVTEIRLHTSKRSFTTLSLAESLCASLLGFYKVGEIKSEKNSRLSFPDGVIAFGYDWLYVSLKHSSDRASIVDSVAKAISNRLTECKNSWNFIEYHLSRQYEVHRLVELFKESTIEIKKFNPGAGQMVVSAPGWGRAGNPAEVEFTNTDDGCTITIVQRDEKGNAGLEPKFYERLNARTIAEFIRTTLRSPTTEA